MPGGDSALLYDCPKCQKYYRAHCVVYQISEQVSVVHSFTLDCS